MPLAAFMPVAQEFEHVNLAFAGVDQPTILVFRDCFKDFRVAVQISEIEGAKVTGPVDACVIRLDSPHATELLRALRSDARRRCVIFGIGSQDDAVRLAEFGVNALIERLTAREISTAIRNTYLLLVHRLRRYVRIPVVMPVKVTLEDGEQSGITRDVSAGGLNISGEAPIPLGRKVKVGFSLPKGPALTVDGVICWQSGTAYGVALFNSSRQARLRSWTEEYLLSGEPATAPPMP